jgi:hypothetical protein
VCCLFCIVLKAELFFCVCFAAEYCPVSLLGARAYFFVWAFNDAVKSVDYIALNGMMDSELEILGTNRLWRNRNTIPASGNEENQ